MLGKTISKESYIQLKKFFQYAFGNVFAILIPFLVAKKTIDICGEELFGKVSIALSVCFILSTIIEYGSFVSPLSKVSIYRNDTTKLNAIFSTVLYGRILLFLITIFVLLLLTLFTTYFKENALLYFFSSTIFLGQILSPLYFFQGLEDFKNTALFTALSKLVYVVLILLLLNIKSDYIYINFFLGIANTIVFTIATLFLLWKYKLKLIKIKSNDILLYLKEDAHLLINSFSMVSILYVPVIFIGLIAGEFWAGIYKVLDIFISLLRNYLSLFFNSIYPKTCLLLHDTHKKGVRFILKYSAISTLFLIVIVFLFIFLKEYFLNYFLKENSDLVNKYFNYVAIPIIIASCNTPFIQVLFYYKQKKYYSRVYLLAAIINLIISYFLIKHLQITGLIWSLIITETFLTVSFILSTEFFLKYISVFRNFSKK